MLKMINAYLTFDGNCAEALRFYERTIGGKLELMTWAQSPMAKDAPPGAGERIMHGFLALDEHSALMAADGMPGEAYEGVKGVQIALHYDTVEQAKKIFNALADGGQVTMPLDKTFWAEAFGMLVDRYGVPWMVNVSAPDQK